MIAISSNDAKQSFGRILDSAQRGPVVIQKHNRPAAAILSIADYQLLRGLNVSEFESFCDAVGARAKQRGLTESKLNQLLAEK